LFSGRLIQLNQSEPRFDEYLNNKAGYVEGIWKIIHWAEAEKRYTAGVENPLIA
jgi:superoxide dismutase